MESGHTGAPQFFALPGGIFNAEFRRGGIVPFQGFQFGSERARNASAWYSAGGTLRKEVRPGADLSIGSRGNCTITHFMEWMTMLPPPMD